MQKVIIIKQQIKPRIRKYTILQTLSDIHLKSWPSLYLHWKMCRKIKLSILFLICLLFLHHVNNWTFQALLKSIICMDLLELWLKNSNYSLISVHLAFRFCNYFSSLFHHLHRGSNCKLTSISRIRGLCRRWD